jgi:hypothetical protein
VRSRRLTATSGRFAASEQADAASSVARGAVRHYGHCHVPVNTHWDPAYTADEVAFVMAVPAADAAHAVVAEKELLPAMIVQSARRAKPKKTGGTKKAKSAVKPRKKAKAAPNRSGK